jgi:hypothetical protein
VRVRDWKRNIVEQSWVATMPRRRRYSIEIKRSPDGLLILFLAADWNKKERDLASAHIFRMSELPRSETHLYWIEIKDEAGVLLLFNTMDWTEEGRPAAVAEICRLAGLSKVNPFTAAIEQQDMLDDEI